MGTCCCVELNCLNPTCSSARMNVVSRSQFILLATILIMGFVTNLVRDRERSIVFSVLGVYPSQDWYDSFLFPLRRY